jgi:hypothetical protein
MSKRELKSYLNSLSKAQLEAQILDLYGRIHQVKTFYDFVFRPKEGQLMEEAKFKISKEYFPVGKRKPKMRRSIAHKLIKHFIQLGVEAELTADLMLFNIEVAQQLTAEKTIKASAFYSSMLKSFQEAVLFTNENGLTATFLPRLSHIVTTAKTQEWSNDWEFEDALNAR